jgi:hypothetical protein
MKTKIEVNEKEIIFMDTVVKEVQNFTECSELEALDFCVSLLDVLDSKEIKIK